MLIVDGHRFGARILALNILATLAYLRLGSLVKSKLPSSLRTQGRWASVATTCFNVPGGSIQLSNREVTHLAMRPVDDRYPGGTACEHS